MTRYRSNPDFDASEFLSDYWQQKPLLIKNYFSDFSDPLAAEELAGLALDETVESRLVQVTEDQRYQLQQGPFDEEVFPALGERNWSLLVQAVDQLVDEVADLKLAFPFLPSWRIDDVMISFATPGGGVGPHFDHYDVFLVQGQGRRRWQLGPKVPSDSHQMTESGLKLLKNFEPEQEVILECGDVLYIPPGYGHWGTAETAGLCYSVGFRAPSKAEMLEAFSDTLIDQSIDSDRFRDLPLDASETRSPGQIDLAHLEHQWQQLLPLLQDSNAFYRSFGKLVTRPRYPELVAQAAAEVPESLSSSSLQGVAIIERNPGSCFAWLDTGNNNEVWVFSDGEAFTQPRANIQAIVGLCDVTIENLCTIAAAAAQEQWWEMLLRLVNQGSLILPADAS